MNDQQRRRKEFFEEHAYIWDEICTHDKQKLNIILDVLNLHEGDSVLDVGTGTGILIPHIIKRVSSKGKIVAVDYSENMIRRAREKYPSEEYANVSFIVEDFFAFKHNYQFDAIMCYSCFPHIDNKKLFFQKSYDLLKEDGLVLIAHSESRAEINEMHTRKHSAICNDSLPSAEKIEYLAQTYDFNLQTRIDDNRLFCLLFRKMKN